MKIVKLKILTSNLESQIRFYQKVLNLVMLTKTHDSATFKIGSSELTLVQEATTTPYHFAINIPSNQENEALAWLKERVTILKDGKFEIQDFDFWNAKAVYFYDEDKNIVELIARKNLNTISRENFNADSFIEISEIGVPTDDIEKIYNQLHEQTGIPIFDGGFERFCAIGNENGLFIAINKKVKDWFPTNDKAYASEFEIDLKEQGKRYNMTYKNEILKLI